MTAAELDDFLASLFRHYRTAARLDAAEKAAWLGVLGGVDVHEASIGVRDWCNTQDWFPQSPAALRNHIRESTAGMRRERGMAEQNRRQAQNQRHDGRVEWPRGAMARATRELVDDIMDRKTRCPDWARASDDEELGWYAGEIRRRMSISQVDAADVIAEARRNGDEQ